jgi:hypothetical protein
MDDLVRVRTRLPATAAKAPVYTDDSDAAAPWPPAGARDSLAALRGGPARPGSTRMRRAPGSPDRSRSSSPTRRSPARLGPRLPARGRLPTRMRLTDTLSDHAFAPDPAPAAAAGPAAAGGGLALPARGAARRSYGRARGRVVRGILGRTRSSSDAPPPDAPPAAAGGGGGGGAAEKEAVGKSKGGGGPGGGPGGGGASGSSDEGLDLGEIRVATQVGPL